VNLNLWNSAEAWESAKKQLVEEFSYLNDSKKKKYTEFIDKIDLLHDITNRGSEVSTERYASLCEN
jgi:peroxiredoxin